MTRGPVGMRRGIKMKAPGDPYTRQRIVALVTDEQLAALEKCAVENKVSKGEVVRRALTDFLGVE